MSCLVSSAKRLMRSSPSFVWALSWVAGTGESSIGKGVSDAAADPASEVQPCPWAYGHACPGRSSSRGRSGAGHVRLLEADARSGRIGHGDRMLCPPPRLPAAAMPAPPSPRSWPPKPRSRHVRSVVHPCVIPPAVPTGCVHHWCTNSFHPSVATVAIGAVRRPVKSRVCPWDFPCSPEGRLASRHRTAHKARDPREAAAPQLRLTGFGRLPGRPRTLAAAT